MREATRPVSHQLESLHGYKFTKFAIKIKTHGSKSQWENTRNKPNGASGKKRFAKEIEKMKNLIEIQLTKE